MCYEKGLWGFLTDYLRTKILYQNGGIYFDTDIEVLKSFDNLFENDFFWENRVKQVFAMQLLEVYQNIIF